MKRYFWWKGQVGFFLSVYTDMKDSLIFYNQNNRFIWAIMALFILVLSKSINYNVRHSLRLELLVLNWLRDLLLQNDKRWICNVPLQDLICYCTYKIATYLIVLKYYTWTNNKLIFDNMVYIKVLLLLNRLQFLRNN